MGTAAAENIWKDRAIGAAVALIVHAAILIGGSSILASSAEYGVDSGDGGMEVHLVAALPASGSSALAAATIAEAEATQPAEALPPLVDPLLQPAAQAPDTAQEAQEAAAEPSPSQGNASIPNLTPYVGDGSSSVPGTDKTTFHSTGGARTNAKPKYFRNPAPAYPPLARERGYEGTVLLEAEVLEDGRCGELNMKQSSGFPILDDAALQAVKRWRFKPAFRGFKSIVSWVEIPVTFRLIDTIF